MRSYHVDCIKNKIDSPVVHEVRETNSNKAGPERNENEIRNPSCIGNTNMVNQGQGGGGVGEQTPIHSLK